MLYRAQSSLSTFTLLTGTILAILIPFMAGGQFYNGSQLTFGKNRVQYNNFEWQHFRFEKFDTYFYINGRELALYTAQYADRNIREIETELQSTLDEKVQFIIFNNLSDLKQSNIGLYGDWDYYNTGGVTRIIGGRVLIFFDGVYEHLDQQIRAGIAQVILNNMIYGTGIGAQIKNNALFSVPEWYVNGLISFIAHKWDSEIENIVRDAILNDKYRKFNNLTGAEATYAGHSLWNYIALKYGRSSIPNIVYMARLSRNVERGFQYVIGRTFNQVIEEWISYYREQFEGAEAMRVRPADGMVNKKKKPERVYRALKVSPQGDRIAYATHEMGIYKVFIRNTVTGKKKRIYRGGYRLADRPDYSYPLLAWNPSGRALSILVERKGQVRLFIYDTQEKRTETQELANFQKVTDMAYSDDGMNLVMSAVQRGQSDIVVFNIGSGSHEQITNDVYDDINPRFINNSTDIIFSSNRPGDTLQKPAKIRQYKPAYYNDLFLYRYSKKDPVLLRLTNTAGIHESQPMPYGDRNFCYLADQEGVVNRFLGRYDSTIAFIDTTTHYRYFTSSFPVTNYSRNILEQDIPAGGVAFGEILFQDDNYRMFIRDLVKAEYLEQTELFRRKPPVPEGAQGQERGGGSVRDSVKSMLQPLQAPVKQHFSVVRRRQVIEQFISGIDTGTVRTGNVIQNLSRSDSSMNSIWSLITDLQGGKPVNRQSRRDSLDKYEKARQLNYNVEYYIDQMVTQIDFTYLNFAYQPYTSSSIPMFINPGLNALFMVGVTDLMEDFRISGGVRLNVDLVNNEYLFSIGNYRRRLDHQIVYHRKSVEEEQFFSIVRHKINELYYAANYPFSPVLSLKGTVSLRYDRAVYLSTDQYNLAVPDLHEVWGSLKGELTYDNTRSLGLNLYKGTRYKIFGEYYQMMNESGNNVFVVGADFRNYQQINRQFIWANRFAASTSFGSNHLLYYMGGVDNWMFPKYDTRTPVSPEQDYAFQTLATNMRGFAQNIRNGNSFFVLNSELRCAVFRYLLNRPIRSDFINNFQLVAFGDIGTAWNGPTPWSEGNDLFTQYIYRNPLFIKVEMQKEPVVEGFGFGARSRLFGYFMRGDVAWGVEDGRIKKPIFYFSLSLDF